VPRTGHRRAFREECLASLCTHVVTRLVVHGSFRSSSHSLVSGDGPIDGYTLAAGAGILARMNAMNAFSWKSNGNRERTDKYDRAARAAAANLENRTPSVASESEAGNVHSPHHFEFVVLNLTFVRNTEQFRALTSSIVRKLSAATNYPPNGFEVVKSKAGRCLLKVRIHPRRYSGVLFLQIRLARKVSVIFCPLTLIWHTTMG
jgi:hypothetical protein